MSGVTIRIAIAHIAPSQLTRRSTRSRLRVTLCKRDVQRSCVGACEESAPPRSAPPEIPPALRVQPPPWFPPGLLRSCEKSLNGAGHGAPPQRPRACEFDNRPQFLVASCA